VAIPVQDTPESDHSSATNTMREAPVWLADARSDLENLLTLPPNWDSYGARPIQPAIVTVAAEWLGESMLPDTPRPAVLPTVRGGVQFEWHLRGMDLEIELASPNHVVLAYEDATEDVEQELNLRAATEAVRGLLSRLSRS
jgi:hypothetical protein